jgi:hypothetical protein
LAATTTLSFPNNKTSATSERSSPQSTLRLAICILLPENVLQITQ